MRIAIDAMGGDFAPSAIVEGAVSAAQDSSINLILVGDQEQINLELKNHTKLENVSILHTPEYILMDESPTFALKKKKQASLILGAKLVKQREAQALISAGNTGAVMEASLLYIGRIKGIKRPALATFWPTLKSSGMFLDSGANSDCKPEYLLQFAQMGDIYAQKVLEISNPKIGLLNIGSEPMKGNAVLSGAYKLLSQVKLNFIGNVEMRDFLLGNIDVAVCDGFVGNMVLKASEAVAEFFTTILKQEIKKHFLAKAGAIFLKPVFKSLKKRLDHSEHGGAILLGLEGICIKSHGRADARTIYNAIKVAQKAIKNNIVEKIKENLDELTKTDSLNNESLEN